MKLIFDDDHSGHHPEFLEHLLQYAQAQHLGESVVFCVPAQLRERFATYALPIEYIESEAIQQFREASALQRSRLQWQYVQQHLLPKFPLDEVVWMNLDIHQYLIGTSDFIKYDLNISGILFQPYYRIPSGSIKSISGLKSRFRKLRKNWQIRWMLRNRHVKRVFILDDTPATVNYNQTFCRANTPQFFTLPDPMPSVSLAAATNLRTKHKLSPDHLLLLVFGSVDSRKNLDGILVALTNHCPDLLNKVALVIIGHVPPGEQVDYQQLLEKAKQIPGFQVIAENRFVDDTERDTWFSQADVVLAPYRHTFVSSGVIGHAAKFGKPVVAPNVGLMAEKVQQYGLGLCVNPEDPANIAQAIQQLVATRQQYHPNVAYLHDHAPEAFASMIFQ